MSDQGAQSLAASIREVQKLQAQVRDKLAKLQAAESVVPKANTAGGPSGTCTNWIQTDQCKASGPVQNINGAPDAKSCGTVLSKDWSGYCVCGNVKVGFDCRGGQDGKTCSEICKNVGAAAYGPLPATDAASCLQGGGVFVGQGSGKGYAAASPGAYFPGCPADAKCCVPLGGTINVSDAAEIYVTGAAGHLKGLNGEYKRAASETHVGAASVLFESPGAVLGRGGGVWYLATKQAMDALKADIASPSAQAAAGGAAGAARASGPFAEDPQRIPVGGHADPWLSDSGDSADASGIVLSATSKADAAGFSKQKADLTQQLQDLEDVETTLLDQLREQRLAASDDADASSLALRAESKAASLLQAESEEQRRRLQRQRGLAAKDTTMIVAARSASLRSKAFTRLTLVALGIVLAAFIIYRLNIHGIVDKDIAFILAAATGGAGLIITTIMLNNINSRNPRDFSKLYFAPPAGPSSLAKASSSPTSDDGDLSSCQRALRAAEHPQRPKRH